MGTVQESEECVRISHSFKRKHDFIDLWCVKPSMQDSIKAVFWRGTAHAGSSLSCTEIELCSELHVLIFQSQIAYGDSKFLFRIFKKIFLVQCKNWVK